MEAMHNGLPWLYFLEIHIHALTRLLIKTANTDEESDGFLDAQGSVVAQATDLGVCAVLPQEFGNRSYDSAWRLLLLIGVCFRMFQTC